MKERKNLCAACAHNLDKTGLDCEFYCAGAESTRTDEKGVVYVTACDDYQIITSGHRAVAAR